MEKNDIFLKSGSFFLVYIAIATILFFGSPGEDKQVYVTFRRIGKSKRFDFLGNSVFGLTTHF